MERIGVTAREFMQLADALVDSRKESAGSTCEVRDAERFCPRHVGPGLTGRRLLGVDCQPGKERRGRGSCVVGG